MSTPDTLPQTPPKASESTTTLSAEMLASAFTRPIPARRISIFYQAGLLLVAVAMILLPLIYLGIIGLAGWGVYSHAVENKEILQMGSGGRGRLGAFLLYVAPIVVGVILIAFMVKPLFARRARYIRSHALKREEEPLLFAFVEHLCKAVRAPMPRTIEVDVQVNASAGFQGGMFSLLSNRLTLTIGLPLVAGLSLRQLAGVLGHEFGHFSQGAGMRISYLIRRINAWFARVVHERDAWDEMLVRGARELDIRIGIVFHVARLLVWLTRKILWVLMILGHAISSFLLRQMEYDADRCEALLVGDKTFEETMRRIVTLSVVYQSVMGDLEASWRERRLGDDVGTLVAEKVHELPDKARQQIQDYIEKSRTRLFGSHPGEAARIARVRKLKADGVFHLDAPAVAVFCNYAATARIASLIFYHEVLGSGVRPEHLAATADLQAHRRQTEEESRTFHRYYQGVFAPLVPLMVPDQPLEAAGNPNAEAQSLIESRERFSDYVAVARSARRKYLDTYANYLTALSARDLIGAGLRIDAASFGLKSATLETARQTATSLEQALEESTAPLKAVGEIACARLLSGLRLWLHPNAQGHLTEPACSSTEVGNYYRTLARLGWGVKMFNDLRRDFFCLMGTLKIAQGKEIPEGLVTRIQSSVAACSRQLKTIHSTYQWEPYPFEHSEANITVAGYLMRHVPFKDDIGEVVGAARDTLDHFDALYERLLGRLAIVAEQLETLLNMPAFPEPPEDEEEEKEDE